MTRGELEEMAGIRAKLKETSGRLAKMEPGSKEFNRLFAYRFKLHKRRAEIIHGQGQRMAEKYLITKENKSNDTKGDLQDGSR